MPIGRKKCVISNNMPKIIITGEMDGEKIWRYETTSERLIDAIQNSIIVYKEEELINEAKRLTYERN